MKSLTVKGLVRSVAVLASGTMASQAILLISSPFLTRLYAPDQFGLLAAYMATVTILGAVSTLRYELVIPLPRRDDMAVNALALTMLCVLVTSVLTAAVLYSASDFIADRFHYPALPTIGWLVPLGVLGMGTYTALNNWAVRRRSFGTIARTKLGQAISQTVIQFASALTPLSTLGLLLGNLVGQSAGITSFAREFHQNDLATIKRVNWRRMGFLARHYWDFPVFSLPASVAFSASQQMPALVMFSLFGPATAGFYLLAQRVGMMPATLLGTAMSQSIYKTLADRKKRPEAIGQAVLGPVRVMSNLTIGPAALAAMIAPIATGIIFGHDWIEAGHYLRWMAPWVCATIVFGAMTPIVSVLGLQKMGLVFQLGSLAASIAGMYAAGQAWGPVAAIAGFSIVKTLSIIIYRLHMFHLVHIKPQKIGLSIVAQTAFFVSMFWLATQVFERDDLESGVRIGVITAVLLVTAAVYAALNLGSLASLRHDPASQSNTLGLP
ncbi:MAG: oligosaccharide flippase family protein [Devosia sp.]